jgi:hypothetical protein
MEVSKWTAGEKRDVGRGYGLGSCWGEERKEWSIDI